MCEYIITGDRIYAQLEDFIDDFADEAEVIRHAECMLLNYGYLEDMQLSKGTAAVSETDGTYFIRYNGLELTLETNERMISDYQII